MNGLLLGMVHYYMYMYAHGISVTHLFHVGKGHYFFFLFSKPDTGKSGHAIV